jgi:hypothetical protein
MKDQTLDNVLRISEVENAIDSLAKALMFSSLDNNFKWKWITLALHDALYTVSLSCLAHNYDDVLESKRGDDDEWFSSSGREDDWYKSKKQKIQLNGRSEPGPPYRIKWERASISERNQKKTPHRNKNEVNVIGFWSAIARVQDGFYWMNRWCVTKHLKLSDDDLEQLWYLHDFVRNNLVHCRPGIHEFDVERIRQACLIVLESISFLLNESLSVVMSRIPDDQKFTSKGYLSALRLVLEQV